MGSWSQHFLPGKEHSTGAPSAIGLGYVFFHEFHRLRKTKQREGSQGMGCTFFGSMPLRKALGRVNICPPPLNRQVLPSFILYLPFFSCSHFICLKNRARLCVRVYVFLCVFNGGPYTVFIGYTFASQISLWDFVCCLKPYASNNRKMVMSIHLSGEGYSLCLENIVLCFDQKQSGMKNRTRRMK